MPAQIEFKKRVYDHFKKYGRDFPWRKTRDPYKILVSEIMLQQTQTVRVIPKYKAWLTKFPNWKKLSSASVKSVLTTWQGLGYNRRALALKQTAEIISHKHAGAFPTDYAKIMALPGIGPYTAGAVLAFAFNIPIPIIETNIRTVFIHEFFKNKKSVEDEHILTLVEKTLDQKNPRHWYWALMDYGAHIKETEGNKNRASAHYTKQSPFRGSNRELRSQILKLIARKSTSEKAIVIALKKPTEKVKQNLNKLSHEGFLRKKGLIYSIA